MFPHLQDVAVQVPGQYEGMEWNWNPASDYILDWLREGRLDTVRLFYKEDLDHSMTDDFFLKHVALEGNSSDEESDWEPNDGNDKTLLVGVEELTSSFLRKPELWRDLGANRVVKTTRAQTF
jgi:hypothetical protein